MRSAGVNRHGEKALAEALVIRLGKTIVRVADLKYIATSREKGSGGLEAEL